jgi:hypothetical protein
MALEQMRNSKQEESSGDTKSFEASLTLKRTGGRGPS